MLCLLRWLADELHLDQIDYLIVHPPNLVNKALFSAQEQRCVDFIIMCCCTYDDFLMLMYICVCVCICRPLLHLITHCVSRFALKPLSPPVMSVPPTNPQKQEDAIPPPVSLYTHTYAHTAALNQKPLCLSYQSPCPGLFSLILFHFLSLSLCCFSDFLCEQWVLFLFLSTITGCSTMACWLPANQIARHY